MVSELDMVRARAKRLDDRAVELGRMCVAWSALELDVAVFLASLGEFRDPQTKNIVVGSMDFRRRVSALRAIAFCRRVNDEWFKKLDRVLGNIEGRMHEMRNRMVHDFWTEVGTEAADVHRMELKPSVPKKGDGRRELKLANIEPVSVDDIKAFCENILKANAELRELEKELAATRFLSVPG